MASSGQNNTVEAKNGTSFNPDVQRRILSSLRKRKRAQKINQKFSKSVDKEVNEQADASDIQDGDAKASTEKERKKTFNTLRYAAKAAQYGVKLGENKTAGNINTALGEAENVYEGYQQGGKKEAGKRVAGIGAKYGTRYYVGKKTGAGFGSLRAGAAGNAASALVKGEGVGSAAEAAAVGALAAKKFQQFKNILMIAKVGSGITVVGVVITILIWGVQLVMGHILRREKWKMSKIELWIAGGIWSLIFVLISLQLFGYAYLLWILSNPLGALFENVFGS